MLDAVITVCGHAHETCPYFPLHSKVLHVGFDDPPIMVEELAKQGESKEQRLYCYRRIRDEVRTFVEKLPGNINKRIV